MSAPLLFVNARVWSGAPRAARALLVRDGRVAAVGDELALRKAAPEAQVQDAAGGTLTPGLTDAHIHTVPWARARRQPDLREARSRSDALARVRVALAASAGVQAPLVGRCWDDDRWSERPD